MNHHSKGGPRVLKHGLSSRLFHWGLVLGFLPAAITGFIICLKPGNDDFVNFAMQTHIVGAVILTISVLLYSILAVDRVVVFIRNISEWSRDDLKWMMVGGGYAHKMILKKEIPVPPMGKMNSGQKSMGVFMFHGGIFLLFSGWILYAFIPFAPKELIYWIGIGHLWIGIFLGLCTFAHIFLGIYNWADFKAMFTDGTMSIEEAQHHNPLWVEHKIELVDKENKSDSTIITA